MGTILIPFLFANLTSRKLLKVNVQILQVGLESMIQKFFSEFKKKVLKDIPLVEVIYKIHLKNITEI